MGEHRNPPGQGGDQSSSKEKGKAKAIEEEVGEGPGESSLHPRPIQPAAAATGSSSLGAASAAGLLRSSQHDHNVVLAGPEGIDPSENVLYHHSDGIIHHITPDGSTQQISPLDISSQWNIYSVGASPTQHLEVGVSPQQLHSSSPPSYHPSSNHYSTGVTDAEGLSPEDPVGDVM